MNNHITIYQHENAREQVSTPYGFEKKIIIKDGDVSALSLAVEFDNCTACYKNGYKKSENFISADCFLADIDNDFTEKTAEWITHDDVIKAMPDVKFYYYPSRNNMKPKNGKPPRPKEHFIFPINETSSLSEYTAIMKKVITSFEYLHFDKAVSGGAQLNFGVESPDVHYVSGNMNITDFFKNNLQNDYLKASYNNNNNEVYIEGTRNNTLFHKALSLLKDNQEADTAHELYIEETLKCSPLLDKKEISDIWNNALKYIHKNNTTNSITLDKNNFEWQLPIRDNSAKDELMSLSKQNRKATIDNIELILKTFGITLRTNEMNSFIEVSGLPATFMEEDAFTILQTIVEDTACKLSFTRNNTKSIYDILYLIANKNHYHPVIELLEKNNWDGQDRFEKICDMLHITDIFYKTLIKKWAIQAIALLYNRKENPVSAQGVLVLQGVQGLGKTEFFRHLAIEDTFFKGGATIDMSNKDTIISATRVWICELGELDSTTKKMQSALKGFLTEQFDRYREPYARVERIKIRKTAFCGTVNPQQFLHDETGNRRYWTIHVDIIDLEEIFKHSKEWYTQFWLQILHEYRNAPKEYLLTAEEMFLVNNKNRTFENDSYGEDEFITLFNVEADKNLWQYKTAAEITEILNTHFTGLRLNASKFGKDLLPRLERRLNITFETKKNKWQEMQVIPAIKK